MGRNPAKPSIPETHASTRAGHGVVFPSVGDRRPTSPTTQGILTDATRHVDGLLSQAIEESTSWRSDYVRHVGDLTRATALSHLAPVDAARHGLASARRRLRYASTQGDQTFSEYLGVEPEHALETRTIQGRRPAVTELEVPYRGEVLKGQALTAQLDRWVAAGVVEPSFAHAVAEVVRHPEWLRLEGRTVLMVGAAAEMSPLGPLLSWGADILAVDVPVAGPTRRMVQLADAGAGRMALPVADGVTGVDVRRCATQVAAWAEESRPDTSLVLGMYAYADGGTHVTATMAVDAMATRLLEERPDTALAYLATPTDAFVVPAEVVAAGQEAYRTRGWRKAAQAPVQVVSGGRLYAPAYLDNLDGDLGVADVLVEAQGPSYAVAKRLQRWRGALADQAGHTVSFNVAPATWTRSVTKNKVLAAAYRGAGLFGIEVFEPDTCRALMAAMLVHDLHVPRVVAGRHPETLFSDSAAHGGLWRAAYQPRSALGIAAAAGVLSVRGRRARSSPDSTRPPRLRTRNAGRPAAG